MLSRNSCFCLNNDGVQVAALSDQMMQVFIFHQMCPVHRTAVGPITYQQANDQLCFWLDCGGPQRHIDKGQFCFLLDCNRSMSCQQVEPHCYLVLLQGIGMWKYFSCLPSYNGNGYGNTQDFSSKIPLLSHVSSLWFHPYVLSTFL